MEEIKTIIKREIDRQVELKMTAFIELISQTYDISLKVLLRDLERTDGSSEVKTSGKQCLGVCVNRKRCKFHAGSQGFCKRHMDQWKPPPLPRREPSIVTPCEHNHTIPPLFSATCPKCIADNVNKPKGKLLIEM